MSHLTRQTPGMHWLESARPQQPARQQHWLILWLILWLFYRLKRAQGSYWSHSPLWFQGRPLALELLPPQGKERLQEGSPRPGLQLQQEGSQEFEEVLLRVVEFLT